MNAMASQITGNWNAFVQPIIQADNKENTKALHYWLIVRKINRSPVDSSYKGPVI